MTATSRTVFLTVLGMGLVTYLTRTGPLMLLAQRRLRPRLDAWLKLLPVAVLAALVVPSVAPALGPQQRALALNYGLGSLATAGIAWKTRSLLASVLAGVATVALARLVSAAI